MLSRKYDKAIDTYAEIGLVGVSNVIPAVLTPVFVNGKLTRVDITNGGKGYTTVPTYEFGNVGNGTDAEITLTMDANGTITSATVKNEGQDYGPNTTLEVRKYSVLVRTDESVNSRWSYTHNIKPKLVFKNYKFLHMM